MRLPYIFSILLVSSMFSTTAPTHTNANETMTNFKSFGCDECKTQDENTSLLKFCASLIDFVNKNGYTLDPKTTECARIGGRVNLYGQEVFVLTAFDPFRAFITRRNVMSVGVCINLATQTRKADELDWKCLN